MQGLLDGAPVVLGEQHSVAPFAGDLHRLVRLPHLIDQGLEPLAGFCGGHGCHGPVRTSSRT